jgi:hypothetical protein
VAYFILNKRAADHIGLCFMDEEVMAKEGITDLSHFNVVPVVNLYRALFID